MKTQAAWVYHQLTKDREAANWLDDVAMEWAFIGLQTKFMMWMLDEWGHDPLANFPEAEAPSDDDTGAHGKGDASNEEKARTDAIVAGQDGAEATDRAKANDA